MSEKKKCNYAKELTKGFLKENPVLRLVLGTCPTLATSTSVVSGVGMGIAATIVLICSNVAISALRKVIPAKARIPAYIVIIASFVTMVQMLVKAFVPALDKSLGVFLPLIVVNCIILGRAEAYASKNPVLASAVDGLGMGIGFTAALFCMGSVREIIGAGTFLSGIDTMLGAYVDLGSFTGFDFNEGLEILGLAPMTIFVLPAGGFFVFGMLMALANKLAEKKGLKSATLNGCKGCPHASFCAQFSDNNDSASIECNTADSDTDKKIPEATEKDRSAESKKSDDAKPADSDNSSEKDKEVIEEVKAESTDKAEKVEKTEEPAKTEDTEKTEKIEEPQEQKKENQPEKETESVDNKAEIKADKEEINNIKQTIPVNNNKNKKKKKKNKKDSQIAAIKAAFDEPVPETIPEFLKNKTDKKSDKEVNEE